MPFLRESSLVFTQPIHGIFSIILENHIYAASRLLHIHGVIHWHIWRWMTHSNPVLGFSTRYLASEMQISFETTISENNTRIRIGLFNLNVVLSILCQSTSQLFNLLRMLDFDISITSGAFILLMIIRSVILQLIVSPFPRFLQPSWLENHDFFFDSAIIYG